ncbi:8927_t:CDS:2, partial [Gigaspora margarita]
SIQASKLTNENLSLNLLVPLINEQSSDSVIINNEQSSDSVINTSESLLPIPIPESGKKMMIVEKQRNTRSKCSGYPWVINAICPKKTGIISITSLYLEHGDHPLDPLTKKFEPMLADIEFWTTKGNLILSNAIQRVKAKQNVDCETATLINYLIERKAEDIQWTINWRDSLLERYPASASYLNRSLGSQKYRWALSYISRIFTEGIQSTQRVEGQNAIIKSAINSHTSILDVFKKIEVQFNRVSITIQYKNWTYSVTGSTLIHSSYDFSPIIDKWIANYLTLAALSMQ